VFVAGQKDHNKGEPPIDGMTLLIMLSKRRGNYGSKGRKAAAVKKNT
jgi:hypothetical protein